MENTDPIRTGEQFSYASLAKEVGVTTKNILNDEFQLLKAEVKEVGPRAAHHSLEMMAFGVLAALSLLPLLAFFVIGLGRLMNDNYWLSSLIVAVVCMGIGIPFAYRSFKRLKSLDLSFNRSRQGLERGVQAMSQAAEAVQHSFKGNKNETTYKH